MKNLNAYMLHNLADKVPHHPPTVMNTVNQTKLNVLFSNEAITAILIIDSSFLNLFFEEKMLKFFHSSFLNINIFQFL